MAKLGEAADASIGEVAILDLIAAGEVRLVVNTPTPRSGAVRDAAEIRLAATAEGILCLTAMETAVAAAEALDPVDRGAPVRGALARGVGAGRRGAGGLGRSNGRRRPAAARPGTCHIAHRENAMVGREPQAGRNRRRRRYP